MSTPREPEGQRPGPGSSVQDREESGEQGQRSNPGTGPGGVPPWQRVGGPPSSPVGPPASGGTQTGGPQQAGPQNGGTPNGGPQNGGSQQAGDQQGQTPPPRPKRPLVTGSAAPKPPGQDATTRTPVAKLDADGGVPQGDTTDSSSTPRGRNSLTGKIIDGPTRNIGRNQVPEDLPDLDAIHHPATAPSGARSVESVPAAHRGPLRAAVQLRRIDPWSTFKVSAVLAIALFLIWMIAIGVLYVILDGMGVWDQINNSFGQLVSSDNTTESSFEITAGTVFGVAAGVGALYVIVFTALTTVGAFIYNMSSDLVGGVEVTLADRD
ncbi:DUF3566 domain-containing protein [Williamsia deligens]|uniref:DUF3566 domain-containing protein n=1 Tax=Williamsia deligens TaxID=321325 RepID=A0ABW3G446_9NOCA|nr:DUF3566 domain-containing protein [Williamsia deligens]MCP2193837.1 Transmembrane protein of unknown function (DUF3566) [Williamsia deligens]